MARIKDFERLAEQAMEAYIAVCWDVYTKTRDDLCVDVPLAVIQWIISQTIIHPQILTAIDPRFSREQRAEGDRNE